MPVDWIEPSVSTAEFETYDDVSGEVCLSGIEYAGPQDEPVTHPIREVPHVATA